jgi:hypothetical protein
VASTTVRLIGDVHGQYDRYLRIAKGSDWSIQLGDLGFNYVCLNELNGFEHRIVSGNHDNIPASRTYRHFLGDFGVFRHANLPFMFMRGGFSIDWRYRTPGLDWWSEEELATQEMLDALHLYKLARPRYVISHECPEQIIWQAFGPATFDGDILRPSRTAILLGQMFDFHKPDIWFFGHYHRWYDATIYGTRFICLPELGVADLTIEEGFITDVAKKTPVYDASGQMSLRSHD